MYTYSRIYSIDSVKRKFSRMPTLIAIILASLMFLLLLAMMSPDDPKLSPENDVNYRQAELSTWPRNQSLWVEDYIPLKDSSSFLLQPSGPNGVEELSPFCGPLVKVLVMVASAPQNVEARMAIRETWGAKSDLLGKGGRILFFLGRTPNTTTEEQVAEESVKYDDIVVEDFLDSYHNLTLKSVTMLKWVNLSCTKNNETMFPKHVLKTDDDIFINFDRLLKVISDLPNSKMIGRLTCGAVPIGDATSKLYMPKYIYPDRVYPGYLSGTAYVLKSEIIPTLLENSLFVPLIHLEDIYITSLLARRSKIFPDDSPFFTYNRLEPKDECAFRVLVNSHGMTPNELRAIYLSLQKPPPKCNLKKAKWVRRIPRVFSKRLRNLCLFP